MKLGPFLGMNTRLEPHALKVTEGRSTVDYVQDALDVVFTNTGRIERAAGTTPIAALAGAHSLWSDGIRTLYVLASKLYKITNFATFASTELVTLTSNDAMSYVGFNGEVYYSNGTDIGRLSSADAPEPMTLATPTTPTVTTTTGSLPAGWYHVSISYTNASGEEGGATPVVATQLTSPGGLTITLPGASTGATHFRIYVGNANATVMTLHSSVTTATASVTITAPASTIGASPTTLLLQPMPAGTLTLHNGRLLSTSGKIITFSEPWNFGLYDPAKNFLAFAEDVSVVTPAQNGVYIAADITRWFAGADIANPETVQDILPYGAVPGTTFKHPDNATVGWLSHKGLVLADTAGQAKAIQDEKLELDYSTKTAGAVVLREKATSLTAWDSAA